MSLFAVTVCLPKNPDHNPRAKVTGPCPVSGLPCTDVTGEHHTFLADLEDVTVEDVRALYQGIYDRVTRVEEVALS